MDLKRKHEIRQMKEYLPGFANGFTPGSSTTGQDFYNLGSASIGSVNSINPFEITGQQPTKAQDIPITLTKNPKIRTAQSTFAEQGGNIVSSAIGFAGAAANAFGPVKGASELMSDAGTSYAAGNGFGYQQQNNIDANKQLDELSKENTNNTFQTMGTGATLGASVGSIIPGVGTAIGALTGGAAGLITGIFGGASRRRRLERKIFAANQQVQATNLFNRSSAHSDYLASTYNQKHTNTQDDLLYGAKCGKDMFTLMPGYAQGYGYTSDGERFGPVNSRVAFGEPIYDPTTGNANIVKTGKLDKDTNLAYLKPTDVVFGNHVDWRTGKTFRDEALPFAAVLEQLRKN